MFRILFRLAIILLAYSSLAQNVPILYINPIGKQGAAVMPNVSFNLSDFNSPNGFIFKSSSEHKKRGSADNQYLKTQFVSGVWNINKNLNNKIFGGIAYLKSPSDQTYKSVKIRGKNPNDTNARDFIKANCKSHWYAYAIAQHESRQRYYVFNQFNSTYYKESVRGIPNCGLPDGWGIMQIDSKRGSKITTDEVYNWQRNILSGIAVMEKAKKEALGYFAAVKRTFPNEWEEPPATIILNGTKTKLSYIDACVIQLYNGASVVRRLKTAYGTYSYYRSAFTFDENADEGERWQFKPNVNNYVFKVVTHEIEKGIKTENEK